MSWKDTGAVAWANLAGERLQLHFGAYLLASTAHSVLTHADDDSHSNSQASCAKRYLDAAVSGCYALDASNSSISNEENIS